MSEAASALRFEAGGRALALPAAEIREIRRPARLTRVPNMPASLLGIANLRGMAVPVLSAARLLSLVPGSERRLVLVERNPLIALAVDRVDRLDSANDVELLDLDPLIESAFGAARTASAPRGTRVRSAAAAASAQLTELLTFRIGNQSFALPLASIEGVVNRAETLARFPHSDPVVLGSMGWRDRTLPILSLGKLLGLPVDDVAGRVVIARIGDAAVGLVVDAVETVLRVADTQIDPVPVALSRGSSEARIQSIVRLDKGRRLVSVLSADTLLRDDLVGAMRENGNERSGASFETRTEEGDAFLMFEIGGEHFGLPLGLVAEVLMTTGQLTTVPHAPAFLVGVFNLRGTATPLIDLGERLGARLDGGGRAIILRIGNIIAGLQVDRVRGIERAVSQPAPRMGDEKRPFDRAILAGSDGDVTLIIDPPSLFEQIEQDLQTALSGRARARRG